VPGIDFASVSPIVPVRKLDIARDRYRRLGFNALHAEWAALDNLDGRLIAPHDTPYRLREFAYVDPDGTLHRIGSPVTR
jgi:hypothetical protein